MATLGKDLFSQLTGNPLEAKSPKEVMEIYQSLITQSQAFKPGGTSRTLFKAFQEITEYYRTLAVAVPMYEKQIVDMHRAADAAEKRYSAMETAYDKLQSTAYPLDKFNQFSTKLYKALHIDGPKIVGPTDLSKFHDVIYAKFQENVAEPDLP